MKYIAIGIMAFITGSIAMWDGGTPELYETATKMDKVLMIGLFWVVMAIGFAAGASEL